MITLNSKTKNLKAAKKQTNGDALRISSNILCTTLSHIHTHGRRRTRHLRHATPETLEELDHGKKSAWVDPGSIGTR